MPDPLQPRSVTSNLTLRATTAARALAIGFVLIVATAGAAHAQTYQVLYTFTGGTDGAQPYAGLSIRQGILYGTAHSGHEGTNWGNVFTLQHKGTGWLYSPIQIFDGTLSSRAVFGPNGTLYGTSPNNLAGYFYGYIYNLSPPLAAVCQAFLCPWNASVLYAFSGGSDGGSPRFGDLVFDQAGDMYGTTYIGGNGQGVVYELMRSGSGWTEQPIYAFSGPDGANPANGVIFDSVGNLYGTTALGGANGAGTVFELSPVGNGWTEKVLYSFQGSSDGGNPMSGLFLDGAGNIYGATSNGGSGGGGTVFELTPSGGNWTYNLLNSFSGNSNCGPVAGVNMDSGGNLYGTTLCDGANNDGNIFKLTRSGGGFTYSSLHDFTGGNDGKNPYSVVVFDSAGDLFGTAAHGGANLSGVVWEITP
ncbi:MAG: choice-of-anchor tandem repeat GloVer-containing protein [Candidatus Korobacteraceae bacterium]